VRAFFLNVTHLFTDWFNVWYTTLISILLQDMNLKEELINILEGEVTDEEKVLLEYSRDASLFEVKPRIVVYPKDTKDIQALVRFAAAHREENISLVCRSGGTDMTGGPLGESVIVDMVRHFNKIKEVGNGYAVVQPGVWYRDFEEKTLEHNLIMPSYPASKEICTVGGMVANNAGGEKTLRYGKTADYVEELKVVLADGNEYVIKPLSEKELQEKVLAGGFEGELYQNLELLIVQHQGLLAKAKPSVSKNSAGYALWNIQNGATFDLTQLFVGSQGTLGIITEIRLRLVPVKKYSTLLVLFLDDVNSLGKLVPKVLEFKPESFELYDDHTLRFALKHIPDFVKLLKGNVIQLGFRFLPEFFMFLKRGLRLPKMVLLAEFTGDTKEEAKKLANEARDGLKDFALEMRVTKDEKESKKYLTIRRESFTLLRNYARGKRTAPFIDDLIVQPEKLPEFLPELETILAKYPQLTYTTVGHIGSGNLHIIPLVDLRDPVIREIIPKLMKEVHELVFRYGGVYDC